MTANDGRPRIAVAMLAMLAACFHPDFSHTHCGDQQVCPSGYACSPENICEDIRAGQPATWTLDLAAFAAGTASAMTIDAHGLTPTAYTYGGLIAHGLQGQQLWMRGAVPSWSQLDGLTASGVGLWRGDDLGDRARLDYAGIFNTTAAITLWLEGEVYLPAGSTQTFRLSNTDITFIELARPGTAAYTRLPDTDLPVAVATPDTGWYPIRIGFSVAAGGNRKLEFAHSDTGGGLVPWTRDRLRARTSELRGALRAVFDRQAFGGADSAAGPVLRIEAGDLLPATTFPVAPQGVSSTSKTANTDWSARYLGQLYVQQPGAYTLRITSDDGNRGRLGDAHSDSHWGRDMDSAEVITATTATLRAGWNDLAVDYNQAFGVLALHVQLEGPDVAGTLEVPHDRLRPVEPADDRLASATDITTHAVPDGGSVTVPMRVRGFSGETVTAAELTYEITASIWEDIKVELQPPGASTFTLRDVDTSDEPGPHTFSFPMSAGPVLGIPAGGDWLLRVSDRTADAVTASVTRAALTLHTTGGPDKIARVSSWTSAVFATVASAFAIERVDRDARLPDGATLDLRVRACQQADCSDNPPWSAAIPAVPITIAPGRYLQLRVDMTSNGVLEPELRSLNVHYRTSA